MNTLRAMKNALGVSYGQIAARAGVSRSTVQSILERKSDSAPLRVAMALINLQRENIEKK